MNERALRWLRRGVGVAVDLAALYAVGVIRWWAQWRGAPSISTAGVDDIPIGWWRYGSLTDLLLIGPDAGNWASNTRAWLDGAPLDVHRLPVYSYLTGWMTRIFDDIAFAGHMVNHLASALTAGVVYFLGRALGGRGVGLGAALLVALAPTLINTKIHYGVDPTLHLALYAFFATSIAAARGPWWMVIPAGLLGGVCAATHYLGLLFPIPVALLVAVGRRRWWARLAAPAALLALSYASWRVLMHPYPQVGLGTISAVYAEGVAGSTSAARVSGTTLDAAVAFVTQRLGGATALALARGLSTLGTLPWALLVVGFWLGFFGPGLGRLGEAPSPEAPRWRRAWGHLRQVWDPQGTLWLVVLMGPLVLMEAARAPDRYTLYGLPLLFIALARGVASACAGLDALLRRAWGRWPGGALAVVAALGLALAVQDEMRARWPGIPPVEEGVQDREIGLAIAEAMPVGEGEQAIATTSQNLPFYTGRRRCPARPCPTEGDVVRLCAKQLQEQCLGRGDIPYVVEARLAHGFADRPNEAMDQAIQERFPLIAETEGEERSLRVYRVTRSGLAELGR
ncbi:MAG: glycosyltransferase family 39 protein [Alphaproteobacteria bacterium]|nr:glycosyltransferase family 39 protein [Alphaproteobacteria bacterium]